MKNMMLFIFILYNSIVRFKSQNTCDLELIINEKTYKFIKENAKWQPVIFNDNMFKNLNFLQASHYHLGF